MLALRIYEILLHSSNLVILLLSVKLRLSLDSELLLNIALVVLIIPCYRILVINIHSTLDVSCSLLGLLVQSSIYQAVLHELGLLSHLLLFLQCLLVLNPLH